MLAACHKQPGPSMPAEETAYKKFDQYNISQ